MSYVPPNYPAINFIVRHGLAVAGLVALVPLAASVLAALSGFPWWLVVIGAAASAVLYLVMKVAVELVCLISDTLIPK